MKFFKEIKEAYSQRDAYQRDYDSSVSNMDRPADHRGLSQELAHETNNLQVTINGRPWKVFAGRGTADSPEEFKFVQSMKAWAEKKSAATGKKWDVYLTGAPVSEGAELKKQNKEVGETQLLENDDDAPMYGAIIHRIMVAHPDLLQKYGPEKIMMAAQEEAEWVGDVEEIGTSDVSISVRRVMQALQEQNPTESIVEEEEENPQDVISLDVPLFIRLLEYAREDAESDMDLHDVAENATKLSAEGATLSMNNYDAIIPSKDVGEPAVPSDNAVDVTEATGHAGYDNMLAVMKAVDASQDAHFDLAGEPITLEYPEARFLAGKYKAFLKAGRQEEFLKYMNDPVMFDRLMLQLRQLIDKQKNFKGSVPGERGVEEAYSMADVRKDAEAQLKKDMDSASDARIAQAKDKKEEPFMAKVGRKIIGGVAGGVRGAAKGFSESKLPAVADNEYFCNIDRVAKPIPEGYKKLASGYITRK